MKNKLYFKAKRMLRELFEPYTRGLDIWACVFCGIFFAINFVWWCYSPVYDLLRVDGAALGLYIAGFIAAMGGFALLILCVREEEERINFDSPYFLFAVLSLAMYVAAWIFYECAYLNFAVFLFLGIFPTVAMMCYALLKKNYLALVPVSLYGIFNLCSNLIMLVAVL